MDKIPRIMIGPTWFCFSKLLLRIVFYSPCFFILHVFIFMFFKTFIENKKGFFIFFYSPYFS